MLERLCDDHGEVGRLTELITDTITRMQNGVKLVMITKDGSCTITKGSWANLLEIITAESHLTKVFQSWRFVDDDNKMLLMTHVSIPPVAVIRIPDITMMYTIGENGPADKEVKWECS